MTDTAVSLHAHDWPTLTPDAQEAVRAFLRRHGIDPKDTRQFAAHSGRLTAELFVTDEDGRYRLDLDTKESVNRQVTVPLQCDPPALTRREETRA